MEHYVPDLYCSGPPWSTTYLIYTAVGHHGLLLSEGRDQGLGVDQAAEPHRGQVTAGDGRVLLGESIAERGDHAALRPLVQLAVALLQV